MKGDIYVTFLIALVEALLFAILCRGAIKKHPGVFYAISIAMVAFLFYYRIANLYQVFPEWTYTYLIAPFWRGAFATALFVIVMYLGAIEKKHDVTKQLMQIRGELAIIGSLITLAHSIAYGIYYVPAVFYTPQELSLRDIVALIFTVPLFVVMILLMVTSFRTVRRKMKARTWKKIQRLSYAWFALLYIYIMGLMVPSAIELLSEGCGGELFYQVSYVFSVVLYTVVFGTYAVLRVRKYRRDKQKRVARLHLVTA